MTAANTRNSGTVTIFRRCRETWLLSLDFSTPTAILLTLSLGAAAMPDIPADSPLRSAPTVVAAKGELPQAELLATPEVRVLLGYSRDVMRLHDGHTLAVFSFSSSAPANWLFLIDGRDLSAERHAIPNNDIASHGAALGADGNIYIMPYGNGRVHHFDVETREFESFDVGLDASEYTWGAVGAPNGRIYFGTYPSATLGEYDPATQTLRTWPQVAPNTKYAHTFSIDDAGKVRFKAIGPDEVWLTFDPKTDEITVSEQHARPSPIAAVTVALEHSRLPEGDTGWRGLRAVGNQRFSVAHPSGRVCEIDPDGSPTVRGETEAFGDPAFWLKVVDDAVVGISYFGVIFRYDTVTGEFARDQIPNSAPGGNGLMFIEAVGGKWVTGANYSQQNLFKVDYQSGEVDQPPWIIARSTGEPMCGVGFGDRLYTGIYTGSILMRYDAAEPFVFAENPRALIELGETYNQTRPRAAVTDGERVYMTSDSAYNHIGGALCTIDPTNDAVQVYHQIIQDQDLPTLAYDAQNQLLWGGTNRWGQMRAHPPTQDSSLIYAFDPAAEELVATLTLWPGSDVTNVLGADEGTIVAQCENEIALIEAATREVLYLGALPVSIPRDIPVGADGRACLLSGGTMYVWDLAANTLTPVAETPGCSMLTEVTPGQWATATSTTIYRVTPAAP